MKVPWIKIQINTATHQIWVRHNWGSALATGELHPGCLHNPDKVVPINWEEYFTENDFTVLEFHFPRLLYSGVDIMN